MMKKPAPPRLTPARAHVLNALLQASHALSHHEVEQGLLTQGITLDRVTLYRALDWLTEQGLALRSTDSERVFRYAAVTPAHTAHGEHAHFECGDCGRVFCLENITPPPASQLPAGFEPASVSLSIRGRCKECVAPHTEGESA